MKRKFSSMGRVAIALVLALSLSLVMAVPVAAEGEANYIGVVLVVSQEEAEKEGTASWVKDATSSGNYAVHLETGLPPGDETVDSASIVVPYNQALSTITDLGYSYKLVDGNGAQYWDAGPYMVLVLDTNDDDTADAWVIHNMFGSLIPDSLNTWVEWELGMVIPAESMDVPDMWQVWDGTEMTQYTDWAAVDTVLGDETVLELKITVGGWTSDINTGHYVDDITINGTTYDLEPIFLDAEYYQTGTAPTVTVCNGNVEEDRVLVSLESGLAEHSTSIWAYEQSGNPGVFEGSFSLVSTLTGVNQLLVIDGDTVTASYTGDWGAGSQTVEATATVDNILPVVTITKLDAFVAGEVLITADVIESNPHTPVLTINGEVIEEATYEAGIVSYTWDTTAEADGLYTIEVVATDLAGNVGSDSIDVTVDNTPPIITDQEATPPVVMPDVENTIVFTATVVDATSGIDVVTIDLTDIGEGTLEMLDDGELPDVEEGNGIYTAEITTTLTEAETPYVLTVTATDLAGLSYTTSEEEDDVLELVCSSDIVPPDIADPAINYTIGAVSARVGDPVVVSATVIDDGILTVTLSAETNVFDIDGAISGLVDMTAVADSDLYEVAFDVAAGTTVGNHELTITATDAKGNSATDTVTLVVATNLTGYNIALAEGWNLMSLPLIPDDTAIGTILASISENVDVVWGYDPVISPKDPWAMYVPGVIEDDLTDMVDGMGYWVRMTEPDILTISGVELPVPNGVPTTPPDYDVAAGWNLIGVKDVTPGGIDYEVYLTSLAGALFIPDYSVIWGYDPVRGYFNVYPIFEEETLISGCGYWLWMKVGGIIVPPR